MHFTLAMGHLTTARLSHLAVTLVFSASLLAAAPLAPQRETRATNEETVASLAAGRVVIAVVKGAILIGTVENPIEADTHPPIPVAIGSERVGVILGTVRWSSPSSQRELARLDEDLPHLRSTAVTQAPHLSTDPVGKEATDLEMVGRGLLDRLNDVAQDLHAKVDLPANEPLAELIVADYFTGYGAEVWQLAYGMKQQEETPGYFTTRVLLPSYAQMWPPEKGQPHTLGRIRVPARESASDFTRFAPPERSPVAGSDVIGSQNGRRGAALACRRKQQGACGRCDAVPARGTRRDRAAQHARDDGHHQRRNWLFLDPAAAARTAAAEHRPCASTRRALAAAPD